MHRAVNRLHESSKYIELAVCLTNTLDAVIADNGRNFVLIHNAILNELFKFLGFSRKKGSIVFIMAFILQRLPQSNVVN